MSDVIQIDQVIERFLKWHPRYAPGWKLKEELAEFHFHRLPLDLGAMLVGRRGDLEHDIFGIHRDARELRSQFVPKFRLTTEAASTAE